MSLSAFDLDHTLLSVNSSYCFGSYLFHQKIMSAYSAGYSIYYYFLHKYFGLSAKTLHSKICYTFFKGIEEELLNALVEAFLHLHFDAMINLPIVQRLRKAQEEGHHVVILSTSPHFLVKPIAMRLGVIESLGSTWKIDSQGKISDVAKVLEGQDKAFYIQDMMQRLAIQKKDVYTYSDSYKDIAFLKAGGSAVAVNPDKALRKTCLLYKWEII